MKDKREINIEVFEDTMKQYKSNPILKAAVSNSVANQKFTAADETVELPQCAGYTPTVTVSGKRSLEAAVEYAKQGMKTCVLNFASAVNPGGGVRSGSSAQEESLCRCSTLYPTLNQRFLWEKYYEPNRAANDPLHTDACIWSPGIVICKLDTSGNPRIAPEGWATVDVISCAAPNLRERTGNLHNPETAVSVHLTSDEQYALHLKRAKHILHIAASKRVEALILGAFGCGAFANDPWAVARAYKDALEEYGQYFKYIEFAVYCRDYETENYDAFRQTLCGRR